MSALQEAIFERLYPKYRQTFGEPPPFRAISVDEAVAYMQSRLRAHAKETARSVGVRRTGNRGQQENEGRGARAAA